jgi:hypothetical protein
MRYRQFFYMAAFLTVCATAALGEDSGVPAANKPEKRSLKDCILPAIKNGGFRMDGFIIWCSSVIKVDDTYHMFASRWPAKYGLGGWTTYSECVRATSKNLYGPYEFQEVVLQKREGYWDSERVHNVKIIKAGPKFLLFYISTANETGYAEADAITGPWTRQDKTAMRVSNPAPFVNPDLSIYCFGRLKDGSGVNRGVGFTAPTYKGPYTPINDGANLLPDNCELEDPTIWWANNQYNVLLNDWKGHATGTTKAGAEYYSKDGKKYTLVTKEPVFTKTVEYDDKTSETFRRRERPFVYVNEKGEVIALFTACLDPPDRPARVVVNPVDKYYPSN